MVNFTSTHIISLMNKVDKTWPEKIKIDAGLSELFVGNERGLLNYLWPSIC